MSLANLIRRAAKRYVAGKSYNTGRLRSRPAKRSQTQRLKLAQSALRAVQRRL